MAKSMKERERGEGGDGDAVTREKTKAERENGKTRHERDRKTARTLTDFYEPFAKW